MSACAHDCSARLCQQVVCAAAPVWPPGLVLSRLALTGGLACPPESVAAALPLWAGKGEIGSAAAFDPSCGTLPVLGALFDLRGALLWRVAAGEEGEGEGLASPLASLTSLFPAYAALGAVYKGAALVACIGGVGGRGPGARPCNGTVGRHLAGG